MSPTTPPLHPELVAPFPQRLVRLVPLLQGFAAKLKAYLVSQEETRARAAAAPEDPLLRGARPLMAAAWYGSLGPGPMCSPGQTAIGFEPGYKD
ncbi:hypothetical protein [Stigmatella aurantiaca]|uniref:Uncharacterized protein n=1 Tax=Stigmatella aurantiaca (strain DW4/3-1) TaxID=378806 RepID=E3FTL2_STIAD|nr:hypothetical protein [Stigmatella aurantiaca]ADO69626.1 uncharacterized protein STAUR_1822 [Stigmatella aurantiaca DW4/3-1]